MKDHKVNLKKLVVIDLLIFLFGIILLTIGILTEKNLNSIAINIIFSLAIILIVLALAIFFIVVFKFHKKYG